MVVVVIYFNHMISNPCTDSAKRGFSVKVWAQQIREAGQVTVAQVDGGRCFREVLHGTAVEGGRLCIKMEM